MENDSIRWQAYEYVYKQKNADWYWALGILGLAMATAAIMLKNFLFAITIVVGTTALSLSAKRKPQLLTCELSDQGVTINNIFYPYSKFNAFGIDDDNHASKLIFRPRGYSQEIILPIETNTKNIRDYLKKRLPEEHMSEPLAHRVMEYLGF